MELLFVTKQTHTEVNGDDPASYVGSWKSAGGFIRHDLLPNGRYVKQRGSRIASIGSYRVNGSRIHYETEDGLQFSGEFVDGALRQGEKIFYKLN
jgi:hypothetical protein